MEPTLQQSTVIAAAHAGESLRVDAVAGAGKSTTFAIAAAGMSAGGIATTFSKPAVEDLQAKFAEHGARGEVKTAHSIGFAGWKSHTGKYKQDIYKGGDNGAYNTALKSKTVRTSDDEDPRPLLYVSGFKRILDTAKSLGYLPSNALGGGRGFISWEDFEEQLAILGLDCPIEDLRSAVDFALHESIKAAWAGNIDFADMLYMPACFGSPLQQTPWLAIDEAQDTSRIQHVLYGRMGAKQRMIIGDPCQGIYAWRGADASAMDTMASEWKLTPLMLTTSFRCPQLVVKEAQAFVPHMEAFAGAPQGIVRTLDRYEDSDFRPGDVVICRFNKPLFQFAFWALKRHIRVTMKGSDVLESLLRVIDKYAKNVANRDELRMLVDAYYQQKIRAAKSDQAADAIRERLECALLVLDEVDPRISPRQVTAEIKASFDGRVGVELTTIHKAKGREWRRVFNLDFDTWPRRSVRELGGPLLDQEYNMKYVSLTRAKEECYFINGGQR